MTRNPRLVPTTPAKTYPCQIVKKQKTNCTATKGRAVAGLISKSISLHKFFAFGLIVARLFAMVVVLAPLDIVMVWRTSFQDLVGIFVGSKAELRCSVRLAETNIFFGVRRWRARFWLPSALPFCRFLWPPFATQKRFRRNDIHAREVLVAASPQSSVGPAAAAIPLLNVWLGQGKTR